MIEQQEQESFVVTARKWRPLTFASVVGQEHITHTLQNAIKSGRIHHAYLFCGPRGVGKTTTARILARAVNCLSPVDNEPCNKCANCTAVLSSRSLDIIEIDGASNNSVDDIRKLRENAKYSPSLGKYKMYIIDEVHMLSTSAFNALLKTLEEPPPHLLFVFATTESHKVPATIISRCQRYDFRRMEIADIVGQLKYIADKENITIDEESLVAIAKKGDGSMRDSQSVFDQVVAFCGNDVRYTEMASALHLIDEEFFFKITDAILARSTSDVFSLAQEVISRGYELQETLQGLLEHFRNILAVVVTGNTKLIHTSQSFLDKYKATAEKFSKADLLRYIQIINSTEQALKFMPQPRIRFELALVSLAEMDKSLEIKELIEELRALKSGVSLPSIANSAVDEKKKPEPRVEAEKQDKPISSIESSSVTNIVAEAQEIIAQNDNNNTKSKEISGDELKSSWKKFLAFIGKKESLLKPLDGVATKFFTNEVLLSSDNKFILGTLDNYNSLIHELAVDFFGVRIKISKVEEKPIEQTNLKQKDEDSNKEIQSETSSQDNLEVVEFGDDNSRFEGKHPVEIKIMKLFNAIEVKSL